MNGIHPIDKHRQAIERSWSWIMVKSGISERTLRRWIKGQHRPSCRAIVDLSKVFSMKIKDLREEIELWERNNGIEVTGRK